MSINPNKKTFKLAIEAHRLGINNAMKAINNYVKRNKKYTRSEDEISARIKDAQLVANSQAKLNSKNNKDPKSLIKTLSSTQRARYHLEDNYKNLVRLIEARKKKWN